VLGFLALTRGLKTGNLSVVGPVAGLSGAAAAIVSIGLGERPGMLTVIGLVVAITGGALASTDGSLGSAAGAGWALLAAVSFGGLFVLVGEADGITAFEAILVARVVGVAIMLPLVIRARSPIPFRRSPIGLYAGLADAAGFVLFAYATQRGPLSVAAVAGAQVASLSAVLAMVLLRERPRLSQLLGIAVIAAGVSLLALDN
jgi:drug/metabolite transporter (DMT)-like permease